MNGSQNTQSLMLKACFHKDEYPSLASRRECCSPVRLEIYHFLFGKILIFVYWMKNLFVENARRACKTSGEMGGVRRCIWSADGLF